MEMKIFVIDDEERQRKAIIKHVDWDRHYMKVTGEAEEGGQAIRLARLDPPDLLITDIHMMGMDGLELSSKMREINSRMHIIMVTGYEEFEYAKSALDLGVDAFLVKPIDFDRLATVLEQIRQSKQMELTKRKEEVRIKGQLNTFKPIAHDNFLQELLHGLILGEEAIETRAKSLDMFRLPGVRQVLIMVIDAGSPSQLSKGEQVRRAEFLRRVTTNAFSMLLEEATTTRQGNIVMILQGTSENNLKNASEYALEKLNQELNKVSFYIGIGPPVLTLSGLRKSFQLAQRAVNQRILGGDERIFRWQTVVSDKKPKELIQNFLDQLGKGDNQSSLSLLGEIISSITSDISIHETEMRGLCLQLVSGAINIAEEIGDVNRYLGSEEELWKQILNCQDELELLQETMRIMTGFCDFVEERNQSHTHVIVQKALKFMNNHYMENISLRSVADSVYLSPNYLGALFRSELGISFTNQLIKIRINKAKELLHQPELRVYEVANGVGYQNIGYFTDLFKRISGHTPKEYRAYLGVPNHN